MKKLLVSTLIFGMALMFSLPALAAKGPIETFNDGCKKELETYCKDVTPGEGRLIACLYAHIDNVSPRCEYAVYDASSQLERALTALTYVASECSDDLDKLCSDIEPGEGRLLSCLKTNADKVSDRCKQAVKDVTE
jgi:hypothetical protein